MSAHGGSFHAHCELLFEAVMAEEGARLPSSRRYEARKRTPTHGIEIPQHLYEACLQRRDAADFEPLQF